MTGISFNSGYGASRANWYAYSRPASSSSIVEPVTPVKSVASLPSSNTDTPIRVPLDGQSASASRPESVQEMLMRYESDPVGMAVRQRIQYAGNEQAAQLPGSAAEEVQKTPSAAEVMEEAECQTCAKRKYQDGSNDPGVSFKTPAHISAENAASVVRGHEMEHVSHEQAKAEQEDRKVVQQSVTLHTDICPECGKVYVSGGTTRTVTAADNSQELAAQQQQKQATRTPFEAVA